MGRFVTLGLISEQPGKLELGRLLGSDGPMTQPEEPKIKKTDDR